MYAIKCDDCKATIRETTEVRESYQGGRCAACRPKPVMMAARKPTPTERKLEKARTDLRETEKDIAAITREDYCPPSWIEERDELRREVAALDAEVARCAKRNAAARERTAIYRDLGYRPAGRE